MLLTDEILNKLSQEAKHSQRLRKNFNLHESIEDKVQRMFNAMEPGTIVPIHRHPSASETMLLLRGSLIVRYYDNDGKKQKEFVIKANSDTFGIHVPKGIWHGVEVLTEGTVMLEVKEGPYRPLSDKDLMNI